MGGNCVSPSARRASIRLRDGAAAGHPVQVDIQLHFETLCPSAGGSGSLFKQSRASVTTNLRRRESGPSAQAAPGTDEGSKQQIKAAARRGGSFLLDDSFVFTVTFTLNQFHGDIRRRLTLRQVLRRM